MRLLLDTHIALWAFTDDDRLSAEAKDLIADPTHEVLLSVASLWEVAIKHSLHRAPEAMPISAAQTETFARSAGYVIVSVEAEHVLEVERLPALHTDPFDRLLLAQARVETAKLLTVDARLLEYGPPTSRA